ncbi:DUF2254 family protein [Occultella gossypii]|uniref:DUF2254 domain-containing protein n=1 Tax=Occultella gossypii TaxID=2800820 RepID=A0ABS7S9A5_9MICO|nr:DUF2254 family protein [Occultella gossypii]MBZ2195866.1 DUF2254 domain-containing protein [Occultella gossypii]
MAAPRSWRARFRTRSYLKDSLWVLPLACALLGALLGMGTARIDAIVTTPVGLQYDPGTATTVLTTIAGAMVGLLGLVVTIGVVVVQQATTVLSPRFMRLWYRQRLQKVVLGTFTGTFTFAFTNLRRVDDGSVPDLGVTLAGILCLTSLVLLLVYLDRFTQHLRPVAVAALVLTAGRREADTALPVTRPHLDATMKGDPVLVVRTPADGVLQGLDARGLLALAGRAGCTVMLVPAVGTFVPAGSTIFEVYGPGVPRAVDLERCVVLGLERTIEQDPAFALRVLVDIAARALSSAFNDPTTAVQVMDYIESFLIAAGQQELPARHVLADDAGVARVVIPGRPWEEYLDLGLAEILHYGATDLQVCRRLAALLDHLQTTVGPERRPAVESHRAELRAAVERSFPSPTDRARAGRSDRQGLGATTEHADR